MATKKLMTIAESLPKLIANSKKNSGEKLELSSKMPIRLLVVLKL